jgi:uncharacterized membrane protein
MLEENRTGRQSAPHIGRRIPVKAKWIKAVYILVGVLIPIPATLLAQHFQSLASRTFFKYWFVVAQIILLFVICLFLGAYIAMYKNLKFIGKPGKWRVK